jgi:hypothetical protein
MRGWNADMGFADTVVPVTAHQSTPVYYGSPALYAMRGTIGPELRPTPGMGWIRFSWVISGAFGLFLLLCLVAGVAQLIG